MEILLLLIPVSVALVLGIGALFWWAVDSGQFDDLDGPAHRILTDDDSAGELAAAPSAQGGGHETAPGGLTSINTRAGGRR